MPQCLLAGTKGSQEAAVSAADGRKAAVSAAGHTPVALCATESFHFPHRHTPGPAGFVSRHRLLRRPCFWLPGERLAATSAGRGDRQLRAPPMVWRKAALSAAGRKQAATSAARGRTAAVSAATGIFRRDQYTFLFWQSLLRLPPGFPHADCGRVEGCCERRYKKQLVTPIAA